jgi:hypothetical protein
MHSAFYHSSRNNRKKYLNHLDGYFQCIYYSIPFKQYNRDPSLISYKSQTKNKN